MPNVYPFWASSEVLGWVWFPQPLTKPFFLELYAYAAEWYLEAGSTPWMFWERLGFFNVVVQLTSCCVVAAISEMHVFILCTCMRHESWNVVWLVCCSVRSVAQYQSVNLSSHMQQGANKKKKLKFFLVLWWYSAPHGETNICQFWAQLVNI